MSLKENEEGDDSYFKSIHLSRDRSVAIFHIFCFTTGNDAWNVNICDWKEYQSSIIEIYYFNIIVIILL